MSKFVKYVISILVFMLALSSVHAQEKYKVIVNEENAVESLTKKEISDLFLKKKINWPDDKKVMPVDQDKDSEIRETFSRDVHGKNSNAINSYWQKQIFSGRNVPPPEKKNDQEIIDYVKNNAGAIGYISASGKAAGVKEIILK